MPPCRWRLCHKKKEARGRWRWRGHPRAASIFWKQQAASTRWQAEATGSRGKHAPGLAMEHMCGREQAADSRQREGEGEGERGSRQQAAGSEPRSEAGVRRLSVAAWADARSCFACSPACLTASDSHWVQPLPVPSLQGGEVLPVQARRPEGACAGARAVSTQEAHQSKGSQAD